MTKAKTLQRKNTSDFVTCWLPIILLGVTFLLSSYWVFYDIFMGWSSFKDFLERFLAIAASFLGISVFILQKANKPRISLPFSIGSAICQLIFILLNFKQNLAGIIILICDVLLILFVALPDRKVKSCYFIFPLLFYAAMLILFPSYYFRYKYLSLLPIYFIGFLTTNTVSAIRAKNVPKNSSVALSRLENLSKLKEQGILTEDEFQKKKAEIMEQM